MSPESTGSVAGEAGVRPGGKSVAEASSQGEQSAGSPGSAVDKSADVAERQVQRKSCAESSSQLPERQKDDEP